MEAADTPGPSIREINRLAEAYAAQMVEASRRGDSRALAELNRRSAALAVNMAEVPVPGPAGRRYPLMMLARHHIENARNNPFLPRGSVPGYATPGLSARL